MKDKKVLAIVIVVLALILLTVFLFKREGGDQARLSPSRGENVTADFIESWQGNSEAELSEKIEEVKHLVTVDFVNSLDAKLEVETLPGIDPVTCLPIGKANFSLLIKESNSEDLPASTGQEEMLIEVRERVGGAEDIFASRVSLVNTSGNWKINEVSCASSDDVETLAE